jgi:hypothetical protein
MYRRFLFVLLALGLVGVPTTPALAADAPPEDPEPAPEPTGDYLQVVDITFPTDRRATYHDDYDQPRSGGRFHKATDLMGQKLWPVFAAAAGTVTYIPGADGSPMPSYGYMITIKDAEDREYHYVHLNNDTPGTDDGLGGPEWAYAAGLERGTRVERGEFIGFMGDSGNAESVGAHLHFQIEDPTVADPYGTGYINPYASVKAAAGRGDFSTDTPAESAARRYPSVVARTIDLACPEGAVPAAGFEDLAADASHADAVDCVVWWQVARGTSETTYAPGTGVTRAQMAAFMARLLETAGVALAGEPADRFSDDDGSPHELRINQLADLGVVGGVAEGRYDPGATVSRAQMATFLVRAVELAAGQPLPAGEDTFADDDRSPHEANVDKVAEAGLASGVSTGLYDPAAGVRRDQMGSFVARTLDLLVEAGRAAPPA